VHEYSWATLQEVGEIIPLSSRLEILDIDSMRGHEELKAHRHLGGLQWG
jgi:hypothetical protein